MLETVVLIALIATAVVMFVVLYPRAHAKPPAPVEAEQPPPPDPPPPFEVGKHSRMRLRRRNQHHMIVAPTGHGKSEFMKTLLLDDAERFANGEMSIVVIDPKGSLIDELLATKEFCTDRTVVIDPRDIEHPFNLGFIDFNAMRQLAPMERAVAYNSAIDMLTITLGSLDADMTRKQHTLFGFLFQLLEMIPDATMETMLAILSKGSQIEFAQYIGQLDELGQRFYNDMFYGSREYNETKDHVARRLFDIFNNPVLRQAFTDPKPSFDWDMALGRGSIILVNLSTNVLRGFAPTFGRFILGRIMQTVDDREGRKPLKPVIVYADEAPDYIDTSVDLIVRKARSAQIGLVLAVQDMSKVPGEFRETVLANTFIKSVGRLPMKEARQILSTVRVPCAPEEISQMPENTMYTFSHDALSYDKKPSSPDYRQYYCHVSRNFWGKMAKNATPSSQADRDALRNRMRQTFAVKPQRRGTRAGKKKEPEFDPTKAERREP